MTDRDFLFNKKFFQYTALFIIFCFLVLIQTTFFGRFAVQNAKLNLIFIAVFLLSFFSSTTEESGEKSNNFAVSAGFIGGFLLDIFSSLPFGVFTFTFLLLAFLIRKSHVFFHKSSKVAFMIAFLLSFLFYKVCFTAFATLLVLVFEGKLFFAWPIKLTTFIEILYNFVIAGLMFLLFRLKKS